MSWDKERSLGRIRRFQETVPQASIKVQDFGLEYLVERRAVASTLGLAATPTASIVQLPFDRAILTDGVHVYADLMDFSQQLAADGQDSEASQRRAMEFLHLHYGSCDRLIDAFGIQRVDFHGSRLHAVVLDPVGEGRERERIVKALAFAEVLRNMVASNGDRFRGRFRTRVSVGIDSGRAVAINSGKRTEHEPLFIGSPANHAAHLAADGPEGVNPSARVLRVLARGHADEPFWHPDYRALMLEGLSLEGPAGMSLQRRVDEAIREYAAELTAAELIGTPATFRFRRHEPPLKTIDFVELAPSKAIRMEMASVFADLEGFTAYIDNAIATGAVAEAISNLHVMRGEFAAALRDDFGGRKVRFIGDCLHGVIAEGTTMQTDGADTVDSAILLAGALRSSFGLCKVELPNISQLGLAIGVDYGITPACRIGLRGAAGVRCVTSTATCRSEAVQQLCNGRETGLGQEALNAASRAARQAFAIRDRLADLDYPTAAAIIRGLPAVRVNQASAPPVHAHSR